MSERIPGFIVLTHVETQYDGTKATHPGLRLNVDHILSYLPAVKGGTAVQTTASEIYVVSEKVDHIDHLIWVARQ